MELTALPQLDTDLLGTSGEHAIKKCRRLVSGDPGYHRRNLDVAELELHQTPGQPRVDQALGFGAKLDGHARVAGHAAGKAGKGEQAEDDANATCQAE